MSASDKRTIAAFTAVVPNGAIDMCVRQTDDGAIELDWFADGAFWGHTHTPGRGAFADRADIRCLHVKESMELLDLDAIMSELRTRIDDALRGRDYLTFDLTATVFTQSRRATPDEMAS